MEKIDLGSLLSAVQDQGIRGTCLAFAVTSAHELARHDALGRIEDLSEEALYWRCKQIDRDQQPGTSFETVSAALEQRGQPHEERWPYDGFRVEDDGSYIPPPDSVDDELCFKAKLKAIPATVDTIKSCLTQGQAVVLGISICDRFLISPQGRVDLPSANQASIGRHAVLVIGYEEDVSQGRWLIFRNSWGEHWGDQGYGYLPYEYVDLYGEGAMVIDQCL